LIATYPIYNRTAIPGSPPTPAPDWPSERKGARGIAAGRRVRLSVTLFHPCSTVAGDKDGDLESSLLLSPRNFWKTI
jgi:hypothetical protein